MYNNTKGRCVYTSYNGMYPQMHKVYAIYCINLTFVLNHAKTVHDFHWVDVASLSWFLSSLSIISYTTLCFTSTC